jgi:hypothetical protein
MRHEEPFPATVGREICAPCGGVGSGGRAATVGFANASEDSGEASGRLVRVGNRWAASAPASAAKATANKVTGISGAPRGPGVTDIASPSATAASATTVSNDDQNGTVAPAAPPGDRGDTERWTPSAMVPTEGSAE